MEAPLGAQKPTANPPDRADAEPEAVVSDDGQDQGPAQGPRAGGGRGRKHDKNDVDPPFHYRIELPYAIFLLLFSIVADIINLIPFMGIIMKLILTGMLLAASVNPFRMWTAGKWFGGKRTARKAAKQEKLEGRVNELNKNESPFLPLWRTLAIIFGGGIFAWILTLILESTPFLSWMFFFMTTLNVMLLIAQSRHQDRVEQRYAHIVEQMDQEELSEKGGKGGHKKRLRAQRVQKLIALGARLRGGGAAAAGAAGQQRSANLGEMATKEKGKLFNWRDQKGAQEDASYGKFKDYLGKRGIGPDKNPKISAGGMKQLGARGSLSERERAAQGKAGLATGAVAGGGIIAGADAEELLRKQAEAEKMKGRLANASIDGVIPEDGIDPELLDGMDALEPDDVAELWRHYQESGENDFDAFMRGLPPDVRELLKDERFRKELAERGMPLGSPDYGKKKGIDGVETPDASFAASGRVDTETEKETLRAAAEKLATSATEDLAQSASNAGSGGTASPSAPDETGYITVRRDIRRVLNSEKVRAALGRDASPEALEVVNALHTAHTVGALSDDKMEILRRGFKDQVVVQKFADLRKRNPGMTLDAETLRTYAKDQSLPEIIRHTADDALSGIPGATLSAEQLAHIAAASDDAAEKAQLRALTLEHAAANAGSAELMRRFGEKLAKSDAELQELIKTKISDIEYKNRSDIIPNGRLSPENLKVIQNVLEQAATDSQLEFDERFDQIGDAVKQRISGRQFASKEELRRVLSRTIREEVAKT